MMKILRDVCNHFRLKFQYCSQKKLKNDTDIWMENHSKIDFSKINRQIIGSHMIRNPCGIIVSAYEYHKITDEPWANEKIKKLNNITYKAALNFIQEKDGIYFEMKNQLFQESSRNTIMDIYNWNYNMTNFLETKYEDLMLDFNGTLTRIFKHYGFTSTMITTALKIAAIHNIQNKDQKYLQNDNHITNKSFDLDKWKTYFSDSELKSKFWGIYPSNIFTKIGYPNYLV
jgi:Sulfotransferase domain